MAEENKNGKTVYPDPEDPELDDLLNDCLEDFNKNETINKTEEGAVGGDNENEIWNNEFLQEQAKLMQSFLSGDPANPVDPSLAEGMQKMAEMFMKGDKEGASNVEPELTASINEVLEKLNLNQEAVRNDFNAENFASLFQNLDAAGETGNGTDFLPFMQNMMQSLLSAEILLPSLSEITSLYPTWLEENGSKIAVSEKERYEKQYSLMKEVVSELEKEKPTDTSDVRQARFNLVLDRMQKMQDLGTPPDELLAQCQKGGPSNLPGLDSNTVPADCNLM